MKTAKEMLADSKKAEHRLSLELEYESEIMKLITDEAERGGTSIYGNWMISDELEAKLKYHGYDISDPMYENLEKGVYESCIYWGDME